MGFVQCFPYLGDQEFCILCFLYMPLLDALGRSYIIRQTWDGKGLKHEKLGVHCSPLFTSIHGFNHVIRSIVNQLFGDGWSNVRYFSAFAWPPFALKSSLFSHLGMGQKKREQDAVGVHFFIVFSRMRSKGSRFTLGVWGLRVCSLDVALVVATVRNRSQPSARGPYGRAYGKFCRGGPFWRFQTCRCFVSRGRRGTS